MLVRFALRPAVFNMSHNLYFPIEYYVKDPPPPKKKRGGGKSGGFFFQKWRLKHLLAYGPV